MSRKTVHGMGIGVFQVLGDLQTGDPAIIARRAEDLGFASYWLPEHTVIPQGSADVYPGKQADHAPPAYLFKLPDPFIGLSRAAAVTRHIALGTGISLVPERNALVLAKEVATLDHYSGGRFLFGIGAGWNEAECRALGGDFAHRWTQTRESVAVMKALWTGEYVEHKGKYYDFPPLVCLPRPARQPHPPILLGSIGSPRVFKRVAEWGDGWLPFCVDAQEIADGKAQIARFAREISRDPAGIDITLFAPEGYFRTRDALREAALAGADNAVLWLRGASETALLDELEALAGELFA